MKSKKKKGDNPDTPSKTALSSEYDAESGLPNPDSTSAGSVSRSSSKKSKSKKSKSNSTPSRRRFSIRNWIFNNPIFPPPFGQSGRNTTVTVPEKTGATTTATAGPSGSSSKKPENPVPDNSWRDNISSHSQGQTEGSLRECPLCMGHCSLDQFPHLRNCPHLFCMECLHTYTKLEIQEGRVNLKCPQCTELIHPNDIALLLGEKYSHLLNLYESLMLRRILATDPDTRWCPRPNCTYAVIAAGCASCPRIECQHPGCGYAFCYHCKAEWHPDQTCDAARAQRNQQIFGSSSGFSLESGAQASTSNSALPMGITANGIFSEVKACPRCQVLAVKNHDGSCNHMTCAVCGVEFCWLCMKEISDLHYLSPSGCTFWGKKPWSRKKKLLWQLGTLIGAPVGIALLAGISIPAMLIGIPSWVGRKIHDHYKGTNKHKRNIAVLSGVVGSVVVSPILAGLAVSIGVPILLCYVYGVVPIALCRSEGCGVTTSSSGVKIDIDEEQDPPYRPPIVANPSIGEVSLGASLSMGSGCILENTGDNASREPDRESASVTAVAGASLTGSVASSYLGPKAKNNRLEVGVDVHPRKKFSFSSERLSETVSLSERSATVSFSEEAERNSVAASTRALAGSLLAYRMGDSQSVHSYRTVENPDCQSMAAIDDGVSLRSLPITKVGTIQLNPPRSMSPVSSMSGDELSHGGRRSQRRRPLLDKQLSENSSLLSAEDATSERVRFDDNISFIDDTNENEQVINADNTSLSGRLLKGTKPSILPEETAEELAEVISPELKPKKDFKGNPILKAPPPSTTASVTSNNPASRLTIDEAGSSILSQGASGVTLLSVGEPQSEETEETLKQSFSAKL